MEVVKKKRGRPKKEFTRNESLRVRLNEDELGMVLYFMNATGVTRSDVIRKALRFYYYSMKNKV